MAKASWAKSRSVSGQEDCIMYGDIFGGIATTSKVYPFINLRLGVSHGMKSRPLGDEDLARADVESLIQALAETFKTWRDEHS